MDLAEQTAALTAQVASLTTQIAALVYWMRVFAGIVVAVAVVMVAVLHRLVRVERWQTEHSEPIERLGIEQEATDAAQALARRRPHRSGSPTAPH